MPDDLFITFLLPPDRLEPALLAIRNNMLREFDVLGKRMLIICSDMSKRGDRVSFHVRFSRAVLPKGWYTAGGELDDLFLGAYSDWPQHARLSE